MEDHEDIVKNKTVLQNYVNYISKKEKHVQLHV